jgi:hypothetical protein
MSCVSSIKFMLACGAVVALSFYFAADANAQRGFRIGNIMQAGGGQGFRLGGPRIGMHFGGGQGASIGTQNLGMRFGNGQGARFGGANFGMQFGGGQGTQIGQLRTTTSGAPGTYFYGDVRNGSSFVQPMAQGQVVGQPVVTQPATITPRAPSMIPSSVNSSPASVLQTGAGGQQRTPSLATPLATGTVGNPAATTSQTDIARQSTPIGSAETTTSDQSMKSKAHLESTTKSILVKEDPAPAKPTPVELGSKRGGDGK